MMIADLINVLLDNYDPEEDVVSDIWATYDIVQRADELGVQLTDEQVKSVLHRISAAYKYSVLLRLDTYVLDAAAEEPEA